MCLILAAYEFDPRYRLILAANRDEFYERPTAPAAFWEDAPDLLAGRDLQAGGTWLGITRAGRYAAITNYREKHFSEKEGAPSRGAIVTRFLRSQDPPETFLERLVPKAERYNGFNLLVGDRRHLFYFSNRADRALQLEPGIYGLSNHLLDTPWPKVEKGKQAMAALLAEGVATEQLLDLLLDEVIAVDEALPDTGVGKEWERVLSPIFIRTPSYGTRSSTVLTIDHGGHVVFAERTTPLGDEEPATRVFEFDLASPFP